jgi:uncharacterized membrane protein
MANRSTTAQLRDKDRHVTVSQHETDSPVLPIAQIQRLKEIHPERVDWVFEETSKESTFRRNEVARVNTFTFIERIAAQCFGLVIGGASLYAAYMLAMAGHDVVAGVIGGTTVVGLVTAFVVGSSKST